MFQVMFHGANLQPEGLEIGEPIVQSSFNSYDFEPAYVIAYSGDTLDDVQISQKGVSVNGIFSSIAYILCNPRWI